MCNLKTKTSIICVYFTSTTSTKYYSSVYLYIKYNFLYHLKLEVSFLIYIFLILLYFCCFISFLTTNKYQKKIHSALNSSLKIVSVNVVFLYISKTKLFSNSAYILFYIFLHVFKLIKFDNKNYCITMSIYIWIKSFI